MKTLVENLQVFTLAESLGGVESLIAHPPTMTHAAMDPEARAIAGITDGLLRLSIGLEAVDDLLADLSRGWRRSRAAEPAAHSSSTTLKNPDSSSTTRYRDSRRVCDRSAPRPGISGRGRSG